MIQPVTFHSAVTKLENYTAGKICDYGVCIPNKMKEKTSEKAGRIRTLTLCIERATIHRICLELNGGPRICLYNCLSAVALTCSLLHPLMFSSHK